MSNTGSSTRRARPRIGCEPLRADSCVFLDSKQPANPSTLHGQNGTDKDDQVDEADPRLVADVELIKGHVPWVRDQYPAEEIDHRRREKPEKPKPQRLHLSLGVCCRSTQVQPSENRPHQEVQQGMEWN